MGLFLRRAGRLRVDSADGLHGELVGASGAAGLLYARLSRLFLLSPVVLYDCSVGHGDCSRCQTARPQYGCVWCKGERPRCVAQEACGETEAVATQCPAPLIHSVCGNAAVSLPLRGLLEGGQGAGGLKEGGSVCIPGLPRGDWQVEVF